MPAVQNTRTAAADALHTHRHLGCHGGVDDSSTLMRSKDAQGVVPEVCHTDKAAAAEAGEALQGQLPGVP
jgi:hypothetical protein